MKWMGCGLQPLDFRNSIVAPERPDSGFSRRRIARRGFYVTAPATYTRQGDVLKMNGMETILSALVAKVTDAQIKVDFDATVAGAGAKGHGDTDRASLAGDRWGGRAARIYAGHSTKLEAVVPDTGWLDGMKSPIKPQDPVDFAAAFKVPVSGLDAGVDGFVRPAVTDQMRARLVKSRSSSSFVVFPKVMYVFNAEGRLICDKAASACAQKLTTDWLKEHSV